MTGSTCSLPIAAELLAEGRFRDALAPLRLAVALGNTTPETLINLAIAEDRAGDRQRGRRLMQHVCLHMPDWDEPHVRLAESFRTTGENDLAEAAYEQALTVNPVRKEALLALAGLLLMRGEAIRARELLISCCGIDPDDSEVWNTLGVALRETGAPGAALSAFVRAQKLRPDCLDYVLNGVNVTIDANEAQAELARLSMACEENPLSPVFQIGRGLLLERMGHRSEAIDALETATHLSPDSVVAQRVLGTILASSSRVREAEIVLRRVSGLEPDNSLVANNLGAVLLRLHQHAKARVHLLESLNRFGPDMMVLCNLANATVCVGRQQEAVAIARQAIDLDPRAAMARRTLCNTLPYIDGIAGADLLAAARDCSATLHREPLKRLENSPDPDRPLVVGLLSGGLRSHPVGWLTVAGFEALDPDQFRLICLAQNSTPDDPIARRFRVAAREWIDVDGLNDIGLAILARERGIDILIDLGGYGDAGRMIACVNRLAPVQIKWVGMQSHSTGLPEMDWFLTDQWETPDGFDAFYSEKLLRLRDGYVCYSPPPHAPDVVELPAAKNGFITFGCFNNLAKITPTVIRTWATIMQRVPGSRLIMKTQQLSDPETAGWFRSAFAEVGVAEDRLELRGGSGHRAFMGEYGHIDFVLDPFPYSGGLTTCEALWMGVPTLALSGEIFASRHSTSHMSNVGLADWVAGSVEQYIEMAISKANDANALAMLRAGLRERMRRSPLCDASRFGQSLGAALRQTWQVWCDEEAVSSL